MGDRMYWRLERIKKRIKIKDIADYLHVSSSYICAHENNRDTLSDYYLIKYEQFIGNKE